MSDHTISAKQIAVLGGLAIFSFPFLIFASQYDSTFPDVINCTNDNQDYQALLYYIDIDLSGLNYGYGTSSRTYVNPWVGLNFYYSSSGAPLVIDSAWDTCNDTIANLYINNRAFDFTNNTSTGGGNTTTTVYLTTADQTQLNLGIGFAIFLTSFVIWKKAPQKNG